MNLVSKGKMCMYNSLWDFHVNVESSKYENRMEYGYRMKCQYRLLGK